MTTRSSPDGPGSQKDAGDNPLSRFIDAPTFRVLSVEETTRKPATRALAAPLYDALDRLLRIRAVAAYFRRLPTLVNTVVTPSALAPAWRKDRDWPGAWIIPGGPKARGHGASALFFMMKRGAARGETSITVFGRLVDRSVPGQVATRIGPLLRIRIRSSRDGRRRDGASEA